MRQKSQLASRQRRGRETPASTSVARTKVSLFGCENWHRFSSVSVVSCVLPGSGAGCGWAFAASWSSGSDRRSGSQQRLTCCRSAARQSQMAERAPAQALFFRILVKITQAPSFHSAFHVCQGAFQLFSSAGLGLQTLGRGRLQKPAVPTGFMENWFLYLNCVPTCFHSRFSIWFLSSLLHIPVPHRRYDDPSPPQRCCEESGLSQA